MKKHYYYLFLLTSFLPLAAFCQTDYYITDSSMAVGTELVNGSNLLNCRFCQVLENGNVVQYTPSQIKEYGFNNGRTYESRTIKINNTTEKVFIERLVSGTITLYYYKGDKGTIFFLERDSTFWFELPEFKRSTRDDIFNASLLKAMYDCPKIIEAVENVSFNKKSLSCLVKRYNTNCKYRPFPVLKYGLVIGFESTELNSSPEIGNGYINQLDIKANRSLTFGFFIDRPISASDFSVKADLLFSQHAYSNNMRLKNKDIDFVANISSLHLPVQVRYTLPSNIIRPFVNAGGCFTYNIKNENAVYEATLNPNYIVINNVSENSIIPKTQYGFTGGGGLQLKINHKNSLFFEFRYTRLFAVSAHEALGNSTVQFLTGINL